MRLKLLVLALVASCGQLTDRDEAQTIVERVFAEDGYELPPIAIVIWYPPGCLPDPWRWSLDPPSLSDDTRCRYGKTLYLALGCVMAVAFRGDSIADTSYAHEHGHCGFLPDPYHYTDPNRWSYTVPRANNALREAGI